MEVTLQRQAAAAATTPTLQRLQRDLLESVAASRDLSPAFARLARVTASAAEANGVFLFRRDEAGRLACAERFSPGDIDILDSDLKETLHSGCTSACRDGQLQLGRFVTSEDFVALSTPVFRRGCPPDALSVVVAAAKAEPAQTIVQLAAAHLTLWHVSRVASRTDAQLESSAAVLELREKLEQCDDLPRAGLTLVGELQAYLQCQQVALGLCRGNKRQCRLEAVSGLPRFDRHADLARTIEAALDEAVLRDAVTTWPTCDDAERHATRAHQRLCSLTETTRVISSPLKNAGGELVGAWIFLGREARDGQPEVEQFIRLAERQVGSSLQLLRESQGNLLRRALRRGRQAMGSWKTKAAALLVCLLLGLLAIPVPYKIRCDAQIQPVTRRFVAAPFDATLEKALVSPGDVVTEGQVLARIDGREIRWELEEVIAEHSRVGKKRDSALAAHKVAEAQLAKLEMERLELRTQLLEHRIRHLEVKSPRDGIVVSGDLEKAEGAPVTIGQTLFEIAPLDRMVVEIAVPEEEVSYVEPAQQVSLRLDAYPHQAWTAEIAKVDPRAEVRDDDNVFIAEFELENPGGMLRPGMKGRTRITAAPRALAWNLFHRPWEKLLQMMGW
jgi:multidrug efflux pump subunit AcrA (membrane-fusion protein)